jgi:serine/threonine-protein kinase
VRTVELRADIYSLGCTLWFLLTRQSPFTGLLAQTLAQQLQREPAWERVTHLPTAVRKLLRIMLRRDPAERPRNAAELQSAIQLCRGSLERRSTVLRKMRDGALRSVRRLWTHPHGRKAFGVGLLVLLFAGGVALMPEPNAGLPEPAVAVAEENASSSAAPDRAPAIAPPAEPAPSGALAERPSNQRPPLLLSSPGEDEVPQPVFFDDAPEPIASLGSDEDAAAPPVKAVAKKASPARMANQQAARRRESNPFVRVHRSVRDLLARVF